MFCCWSSFRPCSQTPADHHFPTSCTRVCSSHHNIWSLRLREGESVTAAALPSILSSSGQYSASIDGVAGKASTRASNGDGKRKCMLARRIETSDTCCAMGGSEESECERSSSPHHVFVVFICSGGADREVQVALEHAGGSVRLHQRRRGMCGSEQRGRVLGSSEPSHLGSVISLPHLVMILKNGEMVGEKAVDGGQAELYLTHVMWGSPQGNERDRRVGTEFVLKVCKKGTFLKHSNSQLPLRLLEFHVGEMENLQSLTPKVIPRHTCSVLHGTLLKDGRFAFLMVKEHFDLHNQWRAI